MLQHCVPLFTIAHALLHSMALGGMRIIKVLFLDQPFTFYKQFSKLTSMIPPYPPSTFCTVSKQIITMQTWYSFGFRCSAVAKMKCHLPNGLSDSFVIVFEFAMCASIKFQFPEHILHTSTSFSIWEMTEIEPLTNAWITCNHIQTFASLKFSITICVEVFIQL